MIKIVDFETKYAIDFKELNYEWITTFFEIEETDRNTLDFPKKYILDDGGVILIALFDQKPVGTCALLKKNDHVYELVKMAVSPSFQGKGIGYKLGDEAINRAEKLGAHTLFLETNSILHSAIKLYRKLGFTDVCGFDSPYQRCNVQMELKL